MSHIWDPISVGSKDKYYEKLCCVLLQESELEHVFFNLLFMFNVFFFNLESAIFTTIASKKEASQMSRSRYNTNQVMMNSKISSYWQPDI